MYEFDIAGRSHLIRLTTLLWLRWCATLGQSLAVIAAIYVYDLDIPVGVVSILIGALIVLNLAYQMVYPARARTRNAQLLLLLVFDTVQLAALVGVTGGLDNPFALLILAPVSVGASVLPYRQAVAVAVIGLVAVCALWFLSVPLRLNDGSLLQMPELLRFGVLLALVIGIVFLSVYARRVSSEIYMMSAALVATQEALAREQKLTDLAGVVAATAHELGTPMATIKLVSSELSSMLTDQPELKEDVDLIASQIDRCRDIMRAMGQASTQDAMMAAAPIQAVVEEAATPHMNRGPMVEICVETPGAPLQIPRKPEILHGLRNLIQNAVDYAERKVLIRISWTADHVVVAIRDDGPGFPNHLINRLGDPVQRIRRSMDRPGYDGMGLGLFISKTLLGRTGAAMRFANMITGGPGAIVEVTWPRAALEK